MWSGKRWKKTLYRPAGRRRGRNARHVCLVAPAGRIVAVKRKDGDGRSSIMRLRGSPVS